MDNLPEYTKYYVNEYSLFISQFLVMKSKNKQVLDYEELFLHNIETSYSDWAYPLPKDYYLQLWLYIETFTNLKTVLTRYQLFMKNKSFSQLPVDFPIEKVQQIEHEMKILKKQVTNHLDKMAFLSYFLLHPKQVDEDVMEYLIIFCGYDGTYGENRIKMLYNIVINRPNYSSILKKYLARDS